MPPWISSSRDSTCSKVSASPSIAIATISQASVQESIPLSTPQFLIPSIRVSIEPTRSDPVNGTGRNSRAEDRRWRSHAESVRIDPSTTRVATGESRTMSAPAVLTHNAYGKSRVRLTKVVRRGDRHDVRELDVDIRLE